MLLFLLFEPETAPRQVERDQGEPVSLATGTQHPTSLQTQSKDEPQYSEQPSELGAAITHI